MGVLPTSGSLIARLRSTYWFLPSMVTALAAALAVGLVLLDRNVGAGSPWLRWAYGGGADGARALLAAVAGSTMTVVSVTLSVMVVALTVSSQHFGPRLLNSFMRDNVAQLMLGAFTGTFVYCLVVLRTVQGDGGDRYQRFVPHLAISVALGLAFVSVGVLIYYVHHIARSLQVSEITAGIARDLEQTIERLYPDRLGDAPASPVEVPAVPAAGTRVTAPASGYVQEIDGDRVLGLATSDDLVVWITARPGAFVIEGTQVAVVRGCGAAGVRDETVAALSRAFTIGADRSPHQDVAFGIQQLVEVALRALSPGVNEPFTAVTSIDRLSQALRRLALRAVPEPVRVGADGTIRVVAAPHTFAELVPFAFEQIATAAASNPFVTDRLLEALGGLADEARLPADRQALVEVADAAMQAVLEGPIRPRQRARLESLRSRITA